MGKPVNTLEYVQVTLPIIIAILGLFGNILSCVVLLRKNFRTHSISIYLLAISVSDSILLISNHPMNIAIHILFGVDYRTISTFGCATLLFMERASCTISAWILVVLTVERILVMSFSRQAVQCISQRRAVIGTLVISIIVGTIPLDSFSVLYLHPSHTTCQWNTEVYGKRISHRICTIDFLTSFLIPNTIMATCDTALVFFLYYSVGNMERPQVENRHIAVTIITLSMFSFLLRAPYWIYLFLLVNNEEIHINTYLYTVLYSLDVVYHSVKCLLYSVTFPDFRQEIRLMFRCCLKRNNSIPQQQNVSEDMQLELMTESV